MTLGALSVGLAATAFAVATIAANYDLTNGETLEVEVDQHDPVTITFSTAQFVSISAATAQEVCGAINQGLAQNGIPAYAFVNAAGFPQIQSNDDGQVVVTGGTAASAFDFESGTTASMEAGAQPSAPTFHDLVSFTGDSNYPGSGGTTGFLESFRIATKSTRNILAIIPADCGGYLTSYNVSADKLKVWYLPAESASKQPMTEVVATTNLSAVTFNVIVISQ